jgi:hypothetical protein
VLSGRGLYDELITRPEESYRIWCVVVCDLETSRTKMSWTALGRSAIEKKKSLKLLKILVNDQLDPLFPMYLFHASTCSLPTGTQDCHPLECIIPDDVLTQFDPPDDEHLLLETCRGVK